MKFLKFLLAMISVANLAFAQAPNLPIGGSASLKALSKCTKAVIKCSSLGAEKPFVWVTGNLVAIKSTDELIALLTPVEVQLKLNDPLSEIYIDATFQDAASNDLFQASQQFTLTKSYDSAGKPVYTMPDWAANLYFQLLDSGIYVAGAKQAYLLRRDGGTQQLDIFNGFIQLPGWMNHDSLYKELVIDGNRYDMITGDLLQSKDLKFKLAGGQFDHVQNVSVDNSGVAVVWTSPQWGTVPNFQIPVVGNHFKLRVMGQNSDWILPVVIRVTTFDDIRKNKPWRIIPFSQDMDITVPTSGTYLFQVEYNSANIGGWYYSGTPTTPVVGGGGAG